MRVGSDRSESLEHADIDSQAGVEAFSLQVKALSRLHELAMLLAGMSEPQPALQAILETLVDVHNADFGLLSLYDPASGFLTPAASVGFDAAALEALAQIATGTERGRVRQCVRHQRAGRSSKMLKPISGLSGTARWLAKSDFGPCTARRY